MYVMAAGVCCKFATNMNNAIHSCSMAILQDVQKSTLLSVVCQQHLKCWLQPGSMHDVLCRKIRPVYSSHYLKPQQVALHQKPKLQSFSQLLTALSKNIKCWFSAVSVCLTSPSILLQLSGRFLDCTNVVIV